MKGSSVLLKSFPNGISVYLDENLDFDALIKQVGDRFKDSAGFFGDAKMALSFEGRKLTEKEEIRLIDIITQSCSLRITCLIARDHEKNQTYIRAIQKVEDLLSSTQGPHGVKAPGAAGRSSKRPGLEDGSDKELTGIIRKKSSEFFRDSLQEGDVMDVPGNIVILGDVKAGARIISTGDILVMGGLYGDAQAGTDHRAGHFVAAMELSPQSLSINGINWTEPSQNGKWPIKPRILPRVAYIEGGMVTARAIDSDAWQEILE